LSDGFRNALLTDSDSHKRVKKFQLSGLPISQLLNGGILQHLDLTVAQASEVRKDGVSAQPPSNTQSKVQNQPSQCHHQRRILSRGEFLLLCQYLPSVRKSLRSINICYNSVGDVGNKALAAVFFGFLFPRLATVLTDSWNIVQLSLNGTKAENSHFSSSEGNSEVAASSKVVMKQPLSSLNDADAMLFGACLHLPRVTMCSLRLSKSFIPLSALRGTNPLPSGGHPPYAVELVRSDLSSFEALVVAILAHKNTMLEEIDMRHNSLSAKTGRHIARTLLSSPLSFAPPVHSHHGHRSKLNRLNGINLGVFMHPRPSLQANRGGTTSVVSLDLSGQELTDCECAILAYCCQHSNVNLRRLNLSHNAIGPNGLHELSTCLERMTMLMEVDMSHNDLKEKQARVGGITSSQEGIAEDAAIAGSSFTHLREFLRAIAWSKNETRDAGMGTDDGELAVVGAHRMSLTFSNCNLGPLGGLVLFQCLVAESLSGIPMKVDVSDNALFRRPAAAQKLALTGTDVAVVTALNTRPTWALGSSAEPDATDVLQALTNFIRGRGTAVLLLDVCSNQIQPTDFVDLFDAIHHTHTNLVDFRFGHNALYDADAKNRDNNVGGPFVASPLRAKGSFSAASPKKKVGEITTAPSLQSLDDFFLSSASRSLLRLDLQNCGLVQLKRSGFLQEFDQSALASLMASLETNDTLTSLNLSQNNIQASSCTLLSAYLSGIRAGDQTQLQLQPGNAQRKKTKTPAGNGLASPTRATTAGATALQRRKCANNKLVHLDLSKNNLGGFLKARSQGQISTYDSSGMEQMMECLASHRHLQILHLDGNNIKVPKAAYPIMQVLRRNKVLQYLDVRGNNLTGECVDLLNNGANECQGSRVLIDVRDNALDRKTQCLLKAKRNRLLLDPEKVGVITTPPEMLIREVFEKVWSQRTIPIGIQAAKAKKVLIAYLPLSGEIEIK
jgi:hypothetical protein